MFVSSFVDSCLSLFPWLVGWLAGWFYLCLCVLVRDFLAPCGTISCVTHTLGTALRLACTLGDPGSPSKQVGLHFVTLGGKFKMVFIPGETLELNLLILGLHLAPLASIFV